ncbi:MAG: ribonuclease R [Deltaproteobacteria bacterium]|nr:ribonuclease R [Deltaproteobacteria bacterium]
MQDDRLKIYELMKEKTGRPLSIEELHAALGVHEEDKEGFSAQIREMLGDGLIIKTRSGRYGLASKMHLVVGELSCHPDGFGFVCPREGEGDDVFVNSRRLSGAMHGDTVVARVESERRGKREGGVIRILKRAHKTIVGRFALEKGFGVVIPSSERLLDRFVIPPEDSKDARHGMIVSAQIVKWPEKNSLGIGRITDVIGAPDDADVEAEVILRKYGLPSRFPADVMEEIRDCPASVAEAEASGRVDLRGKTTFTIDGETAKDFDDAVSIDALPNGYRLRVSIADVSHYVSEGTKLDAEAYARSTSVYFPDRCVPMLPEALSNGICSLNPREDRLTLTAEMEFDDAGRPTGKRLYESVIRSCERLTYTKVKSLLSGEDPELSERHKDILSDLRLMEALAALLCARRQEAGSIDFDLPEPQIIIDIEGKVEDIVRSERNVAHRLIEEFMLAANRAVAEEFSGTKLPFLYRVHDEPDAESVEEFAEFAAGLDLTFKPGGGPKAFQRMLASVAGAPEERLINHVLLRSMRQAVYSDVNIGHFGLAFDDYAHFTSPIRRYPDLVVHRLVRLLINGRYGRQEQDRHAAQLASVASHTSGRERKAMEAEREVVDLKKAQFMRDKTGEVFEGFISGVTSFGLFVELKDYFVEGLIHISALGDDYYIYDEKRHCLVGEHTKKRFRLGDAATVRIAKVDIERRRIDLELEGTAPRQRPAGKGGGRRDRGKARPQPKKTEVKADAGKKPGGKARRGRRRKRSGTPK